MLCTHGTFLLCSLRKAVVRTDQEVQQDVNPGEDDEESEKTDECPDDAWQVDKERGEENRNGNGRKSENVCKVFVQHTLLL